MNCRDISALLQRTRWWGRSAFLGACVALGVSAFGQNVIVNPGAGSYATLTAAFAAINGGTHTGAITVDIVGNTTEGATTAILNASGTGLASYTSILIQPSGGAARSITGATTAGNPMIDLSGADNVTFNGLNSGGNSLTIENTTVSASSGTATIRFIGGATGNTITNCTVRGACSSSVATNGATIFFSTDIVTANGNDNNTISNCDLGPSGVNLPTKAILGNGSTGTTAIGNSGITISNNNIFDYFGAAVTSAGVATNGGCNTWTISNNKFYQTGTRTWTTGALHNAINIQNTTSVSGAQGFTITGNTIGFANSGGTGTYTLTGVAGLFRAIVFNGITGATVSNINNNTIANVSLSGVTSSGTSTSAPLMGIFINNGLTICNGNTIGSQSGTGSVVYSTTSASAADVIAMFNFGVDNWTTNNNLIGGISANNLGTGASNIYGLRCNTGSAVTWTCTGNTIGGSVANSMSNASTATGAIVNGILNSNPIGTFTGNTVRNMTAAGGTGTTTTASMAGMVMNNTATNTVGTNSIFNLANTNTTAATIVTGIQFSGSGTGNVVERNFIYGLTSSTNSASAEVNGIRVGAGTTTYRNNFISLGLGIGNAIGGAATNSSTAGIVGINEALGTNQFWHNSVLIRGTATAGTGASYAFNGVQTTNTRSFRNNIFYNARSNSGATGSHYAVKINGATVNPTGLTINNNIYLANGTGGVFGFFNSANVASIAAWRTAVGQDLQSFETNPQFVDIASTVPDLHINPSIATAAEGNGFDLGVTNDYDGQTRSGLTPVDIGADAGNFTGLDLSAPVITYTPLSGTCTTTDRTITATITDATGVPTSGALQPRIYYRKNAGAWFSSQGVLSSGSGTNGTWTFTIVVADMGGVVVTDVVDYYVIAQDLATPNIASNPGAGLVATSVNAVTTPPTTPNTYTIQNTLAAGTYSIPGAYATLTAAVAAYNTSCLSGPVVFELAAGYTSGGETFPITVNANSFANATNTLTIRPASGQTPVITGSVASGALIRLNGADYVTIDGSNSGGTDRSLTLTNTATTAPAVIWVSSLGNGAGATFNTVRNCVINATAATSATAYGIAIGGATIGSAGGDNDNITVQNNAINSFNVGVYANGNATVSAGGMDALSVTGNAFTGTSTAGNLLGAQIGNALTASVSSNTFSLTTNVATAPVAISLETGVSNSTVTANQITQVAATNTGGYGGRGITVATGSASSNITIANNFVAGVNGSNWSSFANSSSMGIAIGVLGNSSTITTTTGGVNVYHNTVSMAGSMGSGSTTAITTALYIGSGASALDVRNNILVSTQTATSATQKNYAIFSAAANTAFTSINHNDYFVSNSFNAASAVLGNIGSTDRTTLAAIVTGFGGNANSVNIAPVFTSATDLHLVPASNTALNDLGTPIVAVTTDIDGAARSGTNPDMGADEFDPPACVTAVGGTASGSTAFCASGTPTITATGFSTGLGSTYQWYSSTVLGDYPSAGTAIGGQTNPATLTTGAVTTTTYYWLRVTCATNSSTDNSTLVTITINPNPTPSISPAGPVAFCGSGVLTSSAASGNVWNPGGATTTTLTVSQSGNYTVTVTDGNGCVGTSSPVSVTVNPQPSAISVTPAGPETICEGGDIALSVSGGTYTSFPASNVDYGASGSSTAPTSTTATLGPNPLQDFYGGSKQQMVFRASDLTAMGFSAGSTINSIAINLTAVQASYNLSSFRVKTQWSNTINALTTIPVSTGWATQFGPSTVTPVVGFNTFAFSSPMTWNGTDNLLVEFNYSNNNSPTTASNVATYALDLAYNATSFYRADNLTPAVIDAYAMTMNFVYTGRNNVRINGTIPTPAQASITWSPNASLTPNSGANVTAAPTTSTTYNVTATAPGGCTSTTSVTVNVQAAPDAGTNGSDVVCVNEPSFALSTLLGGTPDNGGTWTDPSNNPHSGTFVPGTDVAGVYTYTVAAVAPCAINASATVTITYDNTDTDGDAVIDCLDNCPNFPGVQGGSCDANPGPGFSLGVINGSCACVAVPCTNNVVLDLRPDAANSSEVGWEILDQNTNLVICSGGYLDVAYPDGITTPITEPCCLANGCYRLRVYDQGGDGFVSGGQTGGYQLRESGVNGARIIDNFGNFSSGSVSAIASTYENGAFCVPVGTDKLIFSSCDRLDWVANKFIVASANPTVSAQFGVTNATSGYEFWFFDPNGTYSYRRFRSHATSDGFGTGATRACHFKVNGWINSVSTPHIPSNVLLNVRIRGRVAGNNLPFGPACLFKIDAALAACPRVKLQDDPANTSDFSCGVFRDFGGASNPNNRITAAPPQPIPTVASSNVRYQFRFRIPGENVCIVRPPQNSARLVLNWTTGTPLQCSKTYEVDVRVSLDGGATWCFGPASSSEAAACADTEAWGKVCLVTINPCPSVNGGGNSMVVEGNNTFTMYPNPNRGDQLFLSVNNVEEGVNTVDVDIFDMAGKRVMARTIAVQDGFVNTNMELNGDLAGGLYVVNITAGTKSYTERLVIQP